jgi:cell division protease FtsH
MKKFNNNGLSKNFILWLIIFVAALAIYDVVGGVQMAGGRVTFSDFMSQVEAGQISDVIIRGNLVEGKGADGKRFNTLAPDNYPGMVDKLLSHNVKVDISPVETSLGNFFGWLLSWFPLLLLIGVWIFFMRQMQGGGGKAMGFGKSKAKMISEKNNNVTFAEVAGVDEAKEELTEIVDFLKDPQKFQKLGGKIPKGCLLVGSPGTGKTLLARAIAGEAKVPFFSISGSDFVEMFVGVGASRVRDMFEQAKKHAPCIIFIDEIDAVGRHRGAGLGGGNDEREQTLNQMLVEMDGFAANEGVIVIAATNRPDVLDPALLRPGRFDRQIVVPVPDINGREQILNVHAKKVKLAPDINLRVIARGTPGFSGADLANLVNEAALLAARKNRQVVTMQEMEDAKDKVMMGVERKSMVMKDEEKKLTAYHEGGHALVGLFLPASDPIHKATIIPRGRALGMVMRLPEDDRFSVTREKLKADIAVAMGGRVAEELIFGYDKVTSGASSDIKAATGLARRMVTQWGMSDIIGPILVGDEREEVFLGHSLGHENRQSDALHSTIDEEIKKFVTEGYETAKKILTDNMDKLHLIAKYLLEFETLSGEEIKSLLEGKKIRQNEVADVLSDNNNTKPSVPSGGKKVRKISKPKPANDSPQEV